MELDALLSGGKASSQQSGDPVPCREKKRGLRGPLKKKVREVSATRKRKR